MQSGGIETSYSVSGGRVDKWVFISFGGLFALMGLALLIGAVQLMLLGGSWYYGLAGAGLLGSGALLIRRDVRAFWLFAAVCIATVPWAIWEAGFSFWPQIPRLGPFVLLCAIAGLLLRRLDETKKSVSNWLLLGSFVTIVTGILGMFLPHGAHYADASVTQPPGASNLAAAGDWLHYGRDSGATHFVPAQQINRETVNNLKVAWTFRTGEVNDRPDLQATPLQVGNTLYLCTARNKIFALDELGPIFVAAAARVLPPRCPVADLSARTHWGSGDPVSRVACGDCNRPANP